MCHGLRASPRGGCGSRARRSQRRKRRRPPRQDRRKRAAKRGVPCRPTWAAARVSQSLLDASVLARSGKGGHPCQRSRGEFSPRPFFDISEEGGGPDFSRSTTRGSSVPVRYLENTVVERGEGGSIINLGFDQCGAQPALARVLHLFGLEGSVCTISPKTLPANGPRRACA